MSKGLLTRNYPFTAVLGMEDAKIALICAMVNRDIKGVLIKGVSGVAKTTLVRSLSRCISSKEIINIPLNATEEQLFGSLDLEYAIKEGRIKIQDSILRRANGNILYIDDINLFDQKVICAVMDSVISGIVKVEREGISAEYPCHTTVIATMNLSETYINRKLSDCFDICAIMRGSFDPESRSIISKRELSFADDQDGFYNEFKKSEIELFTKIEYTRLFVDSVTISDEIIETIIGSCMELGSEGYRGELSSIRVSRTLAALNGRNYVNIDDVKKALFLCLQHRRARDTKKKEEKEEIAEKVLFFDDSHITRFIHDDRKTNEAEKKIAPQTDKVISDPQSDAIESVVFDVGESFEVIDLLEESAKASYLGGNSAKRSFMSDKSRDGKYVRSRISDSKNPDLAIDSTIRAAAPYQIARHANGNKRKIIIEKQDIREKIRDKRKSCTFFFMVDTSGSLVVRSRMIAVKTAILSMLSDHYVKRDRVGIMTFNEKDVKLLLPPTKSVDCVGRLLNDIAVGEKTPLSKALIFANDYMDAYVRKHPSERCYIVLMTDGIANVPISEGADPIEESIAIARNIAIPNTDWIVVDTSSKRKVTECAKELSIILCASYYKLDDLKMSENGVTSP